MLEITRYLGMHRNAYAFNFVLKWALQFRIAAIKHFNKG